MTLQLSRYQVLYGALLAAGAALLFFIVLMIQRSPAPRIVEHFDRASVDIAADRGWTVLPRQCVTITWDLEGIKSVYIDGQGKIGWGEIEYCPSLTSRSPDFEITLQTGEAKTFTLDIHFLPRKFLNAALFVATALPFVLAAYYFVTLALDDYPPFRAYMPLMLAVLVLACVAGAASGGYSVSRFLSFLTDLFVRPSWQFWGLGLAAIVYVPLVAQSLVHGIKFKAVTDLVAIASFLFVVVLLYLPFGINGVPHWEGWVIQAFLEGKPSTTSAELATRFWNLVPHALGSVISSDSFTGYHLVHVFMFWGKLVCLYGIFRRLNVAAYMAFLVTMLFMVYPVNSLLISLRSYPLTFNVLSLLVATYLTLEFREKPTRLRLAGIWLALLFHVTSYEAGYVIVLFIPVLWWWRSRKWTWGNINLTAVWYLFPFVKVVYLMLLTVGSSSFYGAHLLGDALGNERTILESVGYYSDIIARVYRQTFVFGWQEAVSSIADNTWMTPTLVAIAVTGITAACLARNARADVFLSGRQIVFMLFSGLLLILPSIGVLMWLEKHNRDLWRMYIYVPVGAAITVFGLIVLISTVFRETRFRKGAMICLCLLVMVPGLSRLFVSHAQYARGAKTIEHVLRQLVDQAPAIDSDALLILLTDMGLRELGDNNLYGFRRNGFDSAIYIVYQDARPRYATLCWDGRNCNHSDFDLKSYDIRDVVTDTSKLILFRLRDDFSVELLHELPAELGIEDADNYDVGRLIDTSAPIPPRRVLTMLASVHRTIID